MFSFNKKQTQQQETANIEAANADFDNRLVINQRAVKNIVSSLENRFTKYANVFTEKGGVFVNEPSSAELTQYIDNFVISINELCDEKGIKDRNLYGKLTYKVGQAASYPFGIANSLLHACPLTRSMAEGANFGRSQGGRHTEVALDTLSGQMSSAKASIKDIYAKTADKVKSALPFNNEVNLEDVSTDLTSAPLAAGNV
jgi:hypothetical protein